jgi:hypothetical protein
MAFVISMRRDDTQRILRTGLRDIPFVLTAEEDYPAPINDYIHGRCRGVIRAPGKAKSVRIRRLAPRSAYKLAINIADVLTWGEAEQAHPAAGVIAWNELRAWQIEKLYLDALLSGFWSKAFFQTGMPQPLDPEYARSKAATVMSCYSWMSEKGAIRRFDEQPALIEIQNVKANSLLSFRNEMRTVRSATSAPIPTVITRAITDLALPSIEELIALFELISDDDHRLSAITMFETGMRADELVHNTLLPGRLHSRVVDGSQLAHPKWTSRPILMSYSLSDYRMIGVLPSQEQAWSRPIPEGQLSYRILGKNSTIRRVSLPPVLLRRIWSNASVNQQRASKSKVVSAAG